MSSAASTSLAYLPTSPRSNPGCVALEFSWYVDLQRVTFGVQTGTQIVHEANVQLAIGRGALQRLVGLCQQSLLTSYSRLILRCKVPELAYEPCKSAQHIFVFLAFFKLALPAAFFLVEWWVIYFFSHFSNATCAAGPKPATFLKKALEKPGSPNVYRTQLLLQHVIYTFAVFSRVHKAACVAEPRFLLKR